MRLHILPNNQKKIAGLISDMFVSCGPVRLQTMPADTWNKSDLRNLKPATSGGFESNILAFYVAEELQLIKQQHTFIYCAVPYAQY